MSILDSLRPRADAVELPLLYVRDTVVFPNTIVPLFASTKLCIGACEEANRTDKRIFVSLLKALPEEGANNIDVHDAGTLCNILQTVKLSDGSLRLLVEGISRRKIKKTYFKKDYLVTLSEAIMDEADADNGDKDITALVQVIKRDFSTYAELVKRIPNELIANIQRTEEAHKLCNLIANVMSLKLEKKQELLSITKTKERLEIMDQTIQSDIEILTLQKRISLKVKAKLDKNQKEYFLQEQLKEINKELGKDGEENEFSDLLARIEAKNPPEEVLARAKKEIARLSKLQNLSPEAGVIRTYCEWLADLPWSEKRINTNSLKDAKCMLDEDHYGLKKAKERIVEYIAVHKLNEALKGPILCLVGPPGTGKTSLGRSIARALNRDFVRMSLGGVRDEAEIRGHRKTYVGALPGKILQSMKKAGSINPVFLLDEIDKMSSDFRGDPASALLEVLDPEQNFSFSDHYLELPYNLSGVMFVTTANSIHSIPYPLLDRMEVIEIPGYSEYEKLEIAKHFIVPKQIEENGLAKTGFKIRDDAILEIIRHYTMESGVRSLEREIAKVVRKTAVKALEAGFGKIGTEAQKEINTFKRIIGAATLPKLLGKRLHEKDLLFRDNAIGVACGLAWTELGGSVLPVEAACFKGTSELILTGNLGDVMKESARAALTFIRSNSEHYGLSSADFEDRTIHVHVPEGAIPKDGPSAGITLVAAISSAFSGKALVPGWAMTGEITLSGRILPIGGVKEKLLAAHRNAIKKILLPDANKKDLDDIPKEVKQDLSLYFVANINDALKLLLFNEAERA